MNVVVVLGLAVIVLGLIWLNLPDRSGQSDRPRWHTRRPR